MTIEERLISIEKRLTEIERITLPLTPLGPRQPNVEDDRERDRQLEKINLVVKHLLKEVDLAKESNEVVSVDPTARVLTNGLTEDQMPDYRETDATGQQKAYVVLSAEERAKGFVRPVRRTYKHVGPLGPRYSLRDLTDDEHKQYDKYGYVKFEKYPEDKDPITGRYWTQAQLDKITKACGKITSMGQSLAETYARQPVGFYSFYSGTFCATCGAHYPVGEDGEFVWLDDGSRVGT